MIGPIIIEWNFVYIVRIDGRNDFFSRCNRSRMMWIIDFIDVIIKIISEKCEWQWISEMDMNGRDSVHNVIVGVIMLKTATYTHWMFIMRLNQAYNEHDI